MLNVSIIGDKCITHQVTEQGLCIGRRNVACSKMKSKNTFYSQLMGAFNYFTESVLEFKEKEFEDIVMDLYPQFTAYEQKKAEEEQSNEKAKK